MSEIFSLQWRIESRTKNSNTESKWSLFYRLLLLIILYGTQKRATHFGYTNTIQTRHFSEKQTFSYKNRLYESNTVIHYSIVACCNRIKIMLQLTVKSCYRSLFRNAVSKDVNTLTSSDENTIKKHILMYTARHHTSKVTSQNLVLSDIEILLPSLYSRHMQHADCHFFSES